MLKQSYPKTQEILRLNIKHFKGITAEQLFIISMQTDYLELNFSRGGKTNLYTLFLLPNHLIANRYNRLFFIYIF
jgi:hypothetical protein